MDLRYDVWRIEQENAIISQFDSDLPQTCYNFRSVLDYLIIKVARYDSGVIQNGPQFPIEDARERFNRYAEVVRLKGINAGHIAMIDHLQPYNGRNWTKLLRELPNNPDSHRVITKIRVDFFVDIHKPISRAHLRIRGKVDVKIGLATTITLDDGTPITRSALDEIKTQVADTLASFKPEF
jgi:hypothetical protein